MSDEVSPQEFDESALFRSQFDPRQFVSTSYNRDGSLEEVDFDFRGPIVTGVPTIKGVAAKLNRLIMYFASTSGDYLRSTKGNEFAFIQNSPADQGTQFRILATAESIMRRRFTEFTVVDLNVDLMKRDDGYRGWNVRMKLRHKSTAGNILLDLPIGDEERLRRQDNIVDLIHN